METIQLKVSNKAARIFKSMDSKRKKQIEMSLENWLEPQKSLEQIMREMSEEAEQNGLTQEILDKILKEK
jgi:hypothetical protein